jgi:hypothetical protein
LNIACRVVFLILLCSPACAFTQDLSFKGSSLGMSLEQWKNNPANASELWVNYGNPSAWRRDKKKTVHISGPFCSDSGMAIPGIEPLFDGDVVCTIAHVGAIATTEVGNAEVSNLRYEFHDGKLFLMAFRFSSGSYNAAASAFTTKYGTATKFSSDSYQNGYGANWTGETRTWNFPGVQIYVAEGSGNGPAQDARDPSKGGLGRLTDLTVINRLMKATAQQSINF